MCNPPKIMSPVKVNNKERECYCCRKSLCAWKVGFIVGLVTDFFFWEIDEEKKGSEIYLAPGCFISVGLKSCQILIFGF